VAAAQSLDIGSVRLTERLMPSDPPTPDEVAAATRVVDEALDTLPSYGVHIGDARTLVGTAGTVTTVAALLLGLDHYDRERIDHATFSKQAVHELAAQVLAMTVVQREGLGVPTGRSDVIGAGALILDRVLRRSGAQRLLVSDSDILDGIAWSIA
jgi:exopolyphosphatase/guanosine-5'-triphosphate,3'-diphosphate pyrophosphatase